MSKFSFPPRTNLFTYISIPRIKVTFTFKFLIHLEFIFVYRVRLGSNEFPCG